MAVSCRPSIAEALVRSHVGFVVHRVKLTGFSPSTSVSPVTVIPPLLHTHSSIYHPHCIMFFSQYFSFPLSVSFHHCSILIHPSTRCCYLKETLALPGNLPTKQCSVGNRETLFAKRLSTLYREIIAVCSQIHTKHINTAVWAERRIAEC